MGIIPTEIVYGRDCLPDFPPGKTPKHFKAFVSGIMRGDLWHGGLPLPPNGYFDLTQDPIKNCSWPNPPPDDPDMGYDIKVAGSFFGIIFWGFVSAFSGFDPGHPTFHFTNLHDVPAGNAYYGGTVFVSTSKALSEIIKSVTPMIDPDPRMECWSMEDDLIVVRYAGKRDATNISIKFDTNP